MTKLTTATVLSRMLAVVLPCSASAYDEADLHKVKTKKACIGCDLSGADLRGLDLSGELLDRANLEGANLEGANLEKAIQSRSRKSAQDDKWSFCLTVGTLCPLNQERL